MREAYSRVRSALANCGYFVPPRHITVNLSPADVKKEGPGFDLPLAIGILHAAEFLTDEEVAGRVFVGELSLDGSVAPVRGTLAISAALANERGRLIVPRTWKRRACGSEKPCGSSACKLLDRPDRTREGRVADRPDAPRRPSRAAG